MPLRNSQSECDHCPPAHAGTATDSPDPLGLGVLPLSLISSQSGEQQVTLDTYTLTLTLRHCCCLKVKLFRYNRTFFALKRAYSVSLQTFVGILQNLSGQLTIKNEFQIHG